MKRRNRSKNSIASIRDADMATSLFNTEGGKKMTIDPFDAKDFFVYDEITRDDDDNEDEDEDEDERDDDEWDDD